MAIWWDTGEPLPCFLPLTASPAYRKRCAGLKKTFPLLNMRVKDLSAERQRSARQFAAAVLSQTRAELDRLLEEQPGYDAGDVPCEPAD